MNPNDEQIEVALKQKDIKIVKVVESKTDDMSTNLKENIAPNIIITLREDDDLSNFEKIVFCVLKNNNFLI